jgi:hypothetical protein
MMLRKIPVVGKAGVRKTQVTDDGRSSCSGRCSNRRGSVIFLSHGQTINNAVLPSYHFVEPSVALKIDGGGRDAFIRMAPFCRVGLDV